MLGFSLRSKLDLVVVMVKKAGDLAVLAVVRRSAKSPVHPS